MSSLKRKSPASTTVWIVVFLHVNDCHKRHGAHIDDPVVFTSEAAANSYVRDEICSRIEMRADDFDKETLEEYKGQIEESEEECRVTASLKADFEALNELYVEMFKGEYVPYTQTYSVTKTELQQDEEIESSRSGSEVFLVSQAMMNAINSYQHTEEMQGGITSDAYEVSYVNGKCVVHGA